jgi:hypothetical protein
VDGLTGNEREAEWFEAEEQGLFYAAGLHHFSFRSPHEWAGAGRKYWPGSRFYVLGILLPGVFGAEFESFKSSQKI